MGNYFFTGDDAAPMHAAPHAVPPRHVKARHRRQILGAWLSQISDRPCSARTIASGPPVLNPPASGGVAAALRPRQLTRRRLTSGRTNLADGDAKCATAEGPELPLLFRL